MDIYFCYPVNSVKNDVRIKCYINQAMNNIFTNPSVNVYII